MSARRASSHNRAFMRRAGAADCRRVRSRPCSRKPFEVMRPTGKEAAKTRVGGSGSQPTTSRAREGTAKTLTSLTQLRSLKLIDIRARDSVYGRARSTSTRETGDTWHVMWTGHMRWPPAQVQPRNRAPRVQDESFFALACPLPVVTAKCLCPDHTSLSAAALGGVSEGQGQRPSQHKRQRVPCCRTVSNGSSAAT